MHARTRLFLWILVLGSPVIVHAAGPQARTVVVTTNTILADMTREITGDSVDVQCLVPVGVDLHGFDPTPRDIAPLLRADLVVANGAGFEPWLERFLGASGYSGPVVNATDHCALLRGHPDAHDHEEEPSGEHAAGETDPHAWQDPTCGRQYIANIRDALCRAAPDQAEMFRRRAQLYSAQIETLDLWARRLFAQVPAARKRIVTPHDSLAYFGRAYGLEILPLRGLDSRAEPSARHMAAIVDALKSSQASALFLETLMDPRAVDQIARDTGVAVGGALLTDSLAPAGSGGSTYLGLLRENTLTVLAAISQKVVASPPTAIPAP